MSDAAPVFSFRTKAGECVIADGTLVLKRTGWRGALSNALFGQSMQRARVIYGVLALLFLAQGAYAIAFSHDSVGGVAMLAFGVLFLVNVLRSGDVSADSEIALASITLVVARAPVPPLTRGYFEVHFSKNGKAMRRYVMLPGVAQGGGAEFEKAKAIFEELGLLGPRNG